MNDLPETPSSLQQPYHVIQLRIPVLSREGKLFFGALAVVAALGLATWAGWSGHAHHVASLSPVYAPSTQAASTAPISNPAPPSTPFVTPDLPRAQTPVAAPAEESTTIYAVQPAAPAPTITKRAVAASTPVAASSSPLTSQQLMADAIENQAAATGQSPSEVIQSLSPGNTAAPVSTQVVSAPAPQTIVVPQPVYYNYGYGPYPYYYGGYPYYGGPVVGLRFGFGFGGGHGGGWHR